MAEQAYVELGAASYQNDHEVEVQLTGCSGPGASPTTPTYSQLSYTTTGQVASYNMYSSTPEPHLLTPSSLTGSPPLPQAEEFIHDYSSPPTTSMSHQPTPPATSVMYSSWTSPGLGVGAPQDGSYSPMDPNHSSTPGPSFSGMGCIVPDDDWINTSYPSRSPSFGHFGVSETSWPEQYCDSNNMTFMVEQQRHDQAQQHPGTTINTPLPQYSPTFSAGDPNALQQLNTLNTKPSGPAPGASHFHDVYNRSRNSGRSKSRVVKDTRRRLRPNAKKGGEQSTPQRMSSELIQHVYKFKEGTSEQNQFLIEEYERCKGARGGTMWTDVRNAYAKKFGTKPEKSTLQMMRLRSLKQCVELSKLDQELLAEAFYEYEKDRYASMIRIFQERGGSLGITAGMMEHHMVTMGYEGLDMNPKTKVRPRMKVPRGGRSTRKRAVQGLQRRANPPILTESQQETLCIQVEDRESAADQCLPLRVMKDNDDVGIEGDERHDLNTFQQPGGLKREYDDI